MKINFTKKQYELLIKIVYLGEWMINAHRTKDTYEEYSDLQNYINSFAKEFGLEKYIEKGIVKKNKYYTNRLFEEETGIHDFHEEYDDETFWDELIDRLVKRDFVNAYGVENIKQMEYEERFEKEDPFIEKYSEEFEKHGIERLQIKK